MVKCVSRNLAVAAALIAALAPAAALAQDDNDRRIAVHNATSEAVTAITALPAGTRGRLINRLEAPIAAGGQQVVDFEDRSGACRVDLVATLAGGRTIERNNFNVCPESGWHIAG